MKIVFFLLIFSCSLHSFCYAQKNRSNFFLFAKSYIDFNINPPTIGTSAINQLSPFYEECICDKKGQLMFYTNEKRLYNKKHKKILSNIENSMTGSCSGRGNTFLLLPHPTQDTIYYLFSQDNQSLFYYQISIDMLAETETVSEKKIFYQRNSAAWHQYATIFADNSIWVLSVDGKDKFLCFKLDSSGLNSTPVVAIIPSNSGKLIIPSLDGTRLCFSYDDYVPNDGSESTLYLWSFDKENGTIDNLLALEQISDYSLAVEFSPNGNLLYSLSNPEPRLYAIEQFDLTDYSQEKIISSQQTITTYSSYQNNVIALAPDKKIYIQTKLHSLDVINFPDKKANDCEFVSNQSLIEVDATTDLPIIKRGSGYQIPKTELIIQAHCSDSPSSFSISSPKTIIYYQWNFGDGSNSAQANPSHTYTNSGTYTVQVLVTYEDGTSQSLTKTITIIEKPKTLTINHN